MSRDDPACSPPSEETASDAHDTSPSLRADGGYTHQRSYHWSDIFPFGAPYQNQKEGIETAIERGKEHGWTVVEGACGTGKTLMALTAGISLVRNPDTDFKRVLAVTSVKQQLTAFEEDLKEINEAAEKDLLPINPVSGVSLVGKADVCPYTQAGAFDDEEVYARCSPLRDATRDIVHGEEDGGAAVNTADNPVEASIELIQKAKQDFAEPASLGSIQGAFGKRPPDAQGTDYCPYYAQYLADDIANESSIETAGRHLTRDRLMEDAVDYGTCPHTTMRDAMHEAEVIVANYQHAFDPTTIDTFSEPIVDSETFLIVDEAHGLVPDVRDRLSTKTTHTTLVEGADECRNVLNWLSHGTGGRKSLAESILDDSDVSRQDIGKLRTLLKELADEVNRRVAAHLRNEFPDQDPPYFDTYDTEIPLRPPADPQPDELTEWARDEGFPTDIWEDAAAIGDVVADIKSTVKRKVENKTGNGTKYARSAGKLLTEWHEADHSQHFREIRVVDRGTLNDEYRGWKQTLKAELWINNCIPGDRLANRLDDYGGGILMSATLAPLDVFVDNVGLNYLTDRPTDKAIYGLEFPPDNRASYAVDLPSFTWKNRHDPFDPPHEDDDDVNCERIQEVRRQYLDAMETVCRTTPGNVLLGLPSYKEARWAHQELQERNLAKDVLCDESSSNEETTELKETFFAGDPKVLVTSLRGTLTEGVDYAGDRLAAACVVGVPIVSLASARKTALKAAYEDEYGENLGFRYAFSVPAVRKARQALGRVIRGTDDVGVRVLLDERYTTTSSARNKVRSIFPDEAIGEYESIYPNELQAELQSFWGSC